MTDSSRYFVVRIEDQGRHAFLGLGFLDRSHAFDFNVALQDHFKYVQALQESRFLFRGWKAFNRKRLDYLLTGRCAVLIPALSFRHLAAEQKAADQKKSGAQQPKLDFSLKEGQTINLTISGGIGSGSGSSQRRVRPARASAPEEEGGMSTCLLASEFNCGRCLYYITNFAIFS